MNSAISQCGKIASIGNIFIQVHDDGDVSYVINKSGGISIQEPDMIHNGQKRYMTLLRLHFGPNGEGQVKLGVDVRIVNILTDIYGGVYVMVVHDGHQNPYHIIQQLQNKVAELERGIREKESVISDAQSIISEISHQDCSGCGECNHIYDQNYNGQNGQVPVQTAPIENTQELFERKDELSANLFSRNNKYPVGANLEYSDWYTMEYSTWYRIDNDNSYQKNKLGIANQLYKCDDKKFYRDMYNFALTQDIDMTDYVLEHMRRNKIGLKKHTLSKAEDEKYHLINILPSKIRGYFRALVKYNKNLNAHVPNTWKIMNYKNFRIIIPYTRQPWFLVVKEVDNLLYYRWHSVSMDPNSKYCNLANVIYQISRWKWDGEKKFYNFAYLLKEEYSIHIEMPDMLLCCVLKRCFRNIKIPKIPS
jgi:hypothetical protein